MAFSDAEMKIVLRAQDQASAQIAHVERVLATVGRQADAVSSRVNALTGRFRAFGAVMQGIAQGIGQAIFFQLERAIGRLVGILPDLIGKGEDWAATLDRMQDNTGMTAEQVFQLAAAAKFVGMDLGTLSTSVARFARNAIDNADAFQRFGVQLVYTSTGAIDVAATLTNARRVMSAAGSSAETTAGLMNLLGRAGFEASDLLRLTDAQLKLITDDARASGLAMDQAAINMAENLQRTRNQLDSTVTGLGAQILTAVGPALSGLIAGISKAIQDNMAAIVRFATQVVNFIAGLISGLFGFNIATVTLADSVGHVNTVAQGLDPTLTTVGDAANKAASGEDALTRSLNRQIAAIDKQLAAMDKRARANNNERDRQQIVGDIETLRQQLEDLKTEGVFTAGMSEAEAELARQHHAQEVLDAQGQLSDAQDRLASHDEDVARQRRRDALEAERKNLQDRLAAHQKFLNQVVLSTNKAATRSAADWAKAFGRTISSPGTFGTSTPGGGMIGAITQAAADARAAGQQMADNVRSFATKVGDFVTWAGKIVDALNQRPFGQGTPSILEIGIGAYITRAILGVFGIGGAAAAGGGVVSTLGPALAGLATSAAGAALGLAAIPLLVRGDTAPNGLPTWTDEQIRLIQTGRQSQSERHDNVGGPSVSAWASPDSKDRSTQAAQSATNLERIARAVGPGGAFFQELSNSLSVQREAADNTADTADRTQGLSDRLAGGINVGVTNKPSVSIPDTIGAKITNVTGDGGLVDRLTNGIPISNTPNVTVGGGVKVTNAAGDGGLIDRLTNGIPISNSPIVKYPPGTVFQIDPITGAKFPILNPSLDAMTFKNGKLSTTTAAGKTPPGGGCFVAGTLVDTPNGGVAIEALHVGDAIYAVDMDTHALVTSRVVDVLPHAENVEQRLLVALTNGTEIETTAGHRFYDPALDEFHPIGDFAIGDAVLDYTSGTPHETLIYGIEALGNDPTDVYNLTVEAHHNYLVAGVLVHNAKQNATGLLAMVNSATDIGVAGEAGNEAVAIVRNPRPISAGGLGGPGGPVHIHLEIDGRQMAEYVTNWQQMNVHRSTSLRPGGR